MSHRARTIVFWVTTIFGPAILAPLVFLALVAASWALRPTSRPLSFNG